MSACPICGTELVSRSQQLRSDDEPTALVTLCPLHGQIGTVLHKYNTQYGSDVTYSTPFVSASLYDAGINVNASIATSPALLAHSQVYHHVCTNIRCVDALDAQAITYTISESRCYINECMCTSMTYLNHPLWTCIGGSDTPCTVVELLNESTWMYMDRTVCVVPDYSIVSMQRGKNRNVGLYEITHCNDGMHIVCLIDISTGVLSVHGISIHSCNASVLHCAVRAYIHENITCKYMVCGCSVGDGWVGQIRKSRVDSHDVVVKVPSAMLLNVHDTMRTVRANGVYGYLYVDRYYALFMPAGMRSVMHLDPGRYEGTVMGPCIAIGYFDVRLDAFSAVSMLLIPYTSSSTIMTVAMLSREITCVIAQSSSDTMELRECRHPSLPNVLFVSSRHPDTHMIDIATITRINTRLLIELTVMCMSHSGSSKLVVFATPTSDYSSLVRRYACVFVCESNWEDEAQDTSYHGMDIKASSIVEGLEFAQPGLPCKVERTGIAMPSSNVMVLGIDNINYSMVEPSSNYLIHTDSIKDATLLPRHSMLGITRSVCQFDVGSLLTRVARDVSDSIDHEFGCVLYCPAHLMAYVLYMYNGV